MNAAAPALAAGLATQAVKGRPWMIATEEAFTTPALAEAYQALVRSTPSTNLDITFMKSIFDNPTPGSMRDEFRRRLLDPEERLRIMDESGVDMHLLSLTIPGVQMFDSDTANEYATSANDFLADLVRRHPNRFAGLACFAPQSPKRTVRGNGTSDPRAETPRLHRELAYE